MQVPTRVRKLRGFEKVTPGMKDSGLVSILIEMKAEIVALKAKHNAHLAEVKADVNAIKTAYNLHLAGTHSVADETNVLTFTAIGDTNAVSTSTTIDLGDAE